MAEVVVKLQHDFKYGGTEYRQITLTEVTTANIIEAHEESEKLVQVLDKNGEQAHEFVVSPTLVGINILRRQITKLGEVIVQLSVNDIKRLHPDDLDALQAAANKMDAAAVKAMEDAAERGRPDASDGDDGKAES
jgi:phage FluMu protein gp41